MPKCDRCGKETRSHIMSRFNTQDICMECNEAETKHPRYREACEAEEAAVRRGDYNFPGIGWEPPVRCNDCGQPLCPKCGECHSGCFLSHDTCDESKGPR